MAPLLRGQERASFEDVTAASAAALRLIYAYAPAIKPVVLVGETGTGKSFLASVLHRLSGRTGQFVDVPAGELDTALAADQLFGHVRGAFTGARDRRGGWLTAAHNGTLLLDDFHLLPRAVQYLLLRTFEQHVFQPVGSDAPIHLSCRLVVGVGQDLDRLVRRGKLLPDLRGRLGHCVIRILPLAQRREEILPFARRFLEEAPRVTGVPAGPTALDREIEGVLPILDYPLNVRDLRGVIEAAYLHAVAENATVLSVSHLPQDVRMSLAFPRRGDRAQQRAMVALALHRSGGAVAEAARLIGVSRNTVSALKQELGGR